MRTGGSLAKINGSYFHSAKVNAISDSPELPRAAVREGRQERASKNWPNKGRVPCGGRGPEHSLLRLRLVKAGPCKGAS